MKVQKQQTITINSKELILFDQISSGQFPLNKYLLYLSHSLNKSYDREVFKEKAIAGHAKFISKLQDANFHLRKLAILESDILSGQTYWMDEAAQILNITRPTLLGLINNGKIIARRENERVIKPFKWSVHFYAATDFVDENRVNFHVERHNPVHPNFHLHLIFPPQNSH